jgi:hypothetical protein
MSANISHYAGRVGSPAYRSFGGADVAGDRFFQSPGQNNAVIITDPGASLALTDQAQARSAG